MTSASGICVANMPRQVKSDVRIPPRIGPITPAKNPPEKKIPSARARAGPLYVALTIPSPVVMSVLPPRPWSARAPSKLS